MSVKALPILSISIALHACAVMMLDKQDTPAKVMSTGTLQAPVALSFTSVSQPQAKQETIVESKVKAKKKPELKPEPKVEQTIAKTAPPKKRVADNAKPVLKPKPVIKKTPTKPKAIAKKPLAKPTPQIAKTQQTNSSEATTASQQSVTQKSVVACVSNEPVMVAKPAILKWEQPKYPKMAQRRNQQGTVIIDVVVDEKGKPISVLVLESSGYSSLDASAVKAVKRWVFQPERRNNHFIKSRVHIPVAFELS